MNKTPIQATVNRTGDPVLKRNYAIRRLNPFLGVLQVVETPGGRAISAKRVVRDIELCAEDAGGYGGMSRGSKNKACYRYSLWSLEMAW